MPRGDQVEKTSEQSGERDADISRDDYLENLQEKSERIEDNAEKVLEIAEEIVSNLKSYNKGIITSKIHKIKGDDFQDFYEELDNCRIKLEEELKAIQDKLEKQLTEFKKELLHFSRTFKSYLRANDGLSSFMEIKGLKYQARYMNDNWSEAIEDTHPGTASAAERYFVKKTYFYDQLLEKIEDDLLALDKKLRSTEEKLKLGEDPEDVARDLYSFMERIYSRRDEHNFHKIEDLLWKLENLSISDM